MTGWALLLVATAAVFHACWNLLTTRTALKRTNPPDIGLSMVGIRCAR